MSRGILDRDPAYWDNAFKLNFTKYQSSAARQGTIHKSHIYPELDSHDLKFENKFPSNKKQGSRIYAQPYGLPYPRECGKTVDKYFRCRQAYGVLSPVDNVAQCNSFKDVVFNECPHWVLENLALKRRFYRRTEQIDTETYRRAMEVSDYNKP
mmetsp:Transcript_10952/g.21431  ORF Transcript_10952/g.21431 Transcript_10952/m.21431 type:complete len:153 (-) Transcript_10952:5321-5779(-)